MTPKEVAALIAAGFKNEKGRYQVFLVTAIKVGDDLLSRCAVSSAARA